MGYLWDYLDKKTYNNRVGKYKFKRHYDFIKKNSNYKLDAVLDIAGGSGRFALPLYEYCTDITVVDISSEAIELLNQRNKEIKTITGDFMKAEITTCFSLIICIEALGYFNDYELFFNKIKSNLSKDGLFIFSYANPDSWRFFLRKIRHLRKGPQAYNQIALADLKQLLTRLNFEIVDMEGMNWIPLPLTSNSPFVTLFEKLEKVLGLKKWYSQSPWILFSIKKSNNK
jgi:SAM-dependent methyltransferase